MGMKTQLFRSPLFVCLLFLSLLLLLIPQVLGNGDDEHHNMWGDTWHNMWGGGMWMWLLILLGLAFLAAIYFFAMQSRRTRKPYQRKDELQVAGERLARGEITTEEFDEVNKRLR
jgi:putative membrane protein